MDILDNVYGQKAKLCTWMIHISSYIIIKTKLYIKLLVVLTWKMCIALNGFMGVLGIDLWGVNYGRDEKNGWSVCDTGCSHGSANEDNIFV